jgi:uncharacterized protein YjiS (DUF1127 family)
MFSFIAARLRAWRERERAFGELMSLDDRSLADIGIRRADIPFVLDRTHTSGHEPGARRPVGVAANANEAPAAPQRAA